jgi:hypothetical protein
MKTLTEWLVDEKIADNGFAAGHIAEGLKLAGLPREEQEARCRLYRVWRNDKEAKKSVSSKQAYDLSIAGIDPKDVEPRQMIFPAPHYHSVFNGNEWADLHGEWDAE